MIKCGKCSGRVFVDRTYSDGTHLELVCINCGKGWALNKEKNGMARWLVKQEREKLHALAVAT
jgi:DNA-directed RNA polymerase subunit RPC12/RpoP